MMSLGTPIGSARIARRHQRGAARPAGGDHAGDVALAAQPVGEGLRHRRHRGAAIRAEHGAAAARVVERNFLRGDIAGRELAAGRDVDEPRAQAAARHDVADESEFLALGIQRAGDEHGRRSGASRCRRVASRPRGLLEPRAHRSKASARRTRCARSAPAATIGSAASDWKCRCGSAPGSVGRGEAGRACGVVVRAPRRSSGSASA